MSKPSLTTLLCHFRLLPVFGAHGATTCKRDQEWLGRAGSLPPWAATWCAGSGPEASASNTLSKICISNSVCPGYAPFSLHRSRQNALAACPHRPCDQFETSWYLVGRDPVCEHEAFTL